MKMFLALTVLLMASTGFAKAPFMSGEFNCEDGGRLSLKYVPDRVMYYASLDYKDGSSSTLNRVVLQGNQAIILTDDGDAIGTVTKSGAGAVLFLKLGRKTLMCSHTVWGGVGRE